MLATALYNVYIFIHSLIINSELFNTIIDITLGYTFLEKNTYDHIIIYEYIHFLYTLS